MHANPYPATIRDDASHIDMPNQRHQDWEMGYQACQEDLVRIKKLMIERINRYEAEA